MDQDLTRIVMLLDRSASMSGKTNETIEGVNAFLQEQRTAPGRAEVDIILFDAPWGLHDGKDGIFGMDTDLDLRRAFETDPFYRVIQRRADPNRVDNINKAVYTARGNTPLFDAMARAIDELGTELRGTLEDQRPGRVIFVTFTDGEENRSVRNTQGQVASRVKTQKDGYNWQFLFMGCDEGSLLTARDLGIQDRLSYVGSAKGSRASFKKVGAQIRSLRSRAVGASLDMGVVSVNEDGQDIIGSSTSSTTPPGIESNKKTSDYSSGRRR